MAPTTNGLKTQGTPGLVPVPDPTALTNDLVRAAVEAAVQRLEARLEGNDKLQIEKFIALEGRIAANREAVEDRFKIEAEARIKAASDVKSAVDAAFAAAKDGVTQQNQANFLASQKQEAAFTKQMDQLTASVLQISKAADDKLNDLKKTTDDKLGDLKDRIVAMEGRSSVSDPHTAVALREMSSSIATLKSISDQSAARRDQSSSSMALIIAIVAAVAAVGIVLVDWLGFASRAHPG